MLTFLRKKKYGRISGEIISDWIRMKYWRKPRKSFWKPTIILWRESRGIPGEISGKKIFGVTQYVNWEICKVVYCSISASILGPSVTPGGIPKEILECIFARILVLAESWSACKNFWRHFWSTVRWKRSLEKSLKYLGMNIAIPEGIYKKQISVNIILEESREKSLKEFLQEFLKKLLEKSVRNHW